MDSRYTDDELSLLVDFSGICVRHGCASRVVYSESSGQVDGREAVERDQLAVDASIRIFLSARHLAHVPVTNRGELPASHPNELKSRGLLIRHPNTKTQASSPFKTGFRRT